MTAQLRLLPKPREAKLIHHVSWEQLEEIDRSLEDFAEVRLAYLDGTLEIMPLSAEHEDFKSNIVVLLEAYMRAKNIRFYKRGSATLGRKEQGARNEPDEAYNLGTRKPYPDLVVEVVKTSDGIDKLEGYRRMGVAEVWFWDDGVLGIHHLQDDQYTQIDQSQLLPGLPLATFLRYVVYHDQYDAVTEFLAAL